MRPRSLSFALLAAFALACGSQDAPAPVRSAGADLGAAPDRFRCTFCGFAGLQTYEAPGEPACDVEALTLDGGFSWVEDARGVTVRAYGTFAEARAYVDGLCSGDY